MIDSDFDELDQLILFAKRANATITITPWGEVTIQTVKEKNIPVATTNFLGGQLRRAVDEHSRKVLS